LQPIGNYIRIQPIKPPEEPLIKQAQVIAYATVLEIPPGEVLPFSVGDEIAYISGRIIRQENESFIDKEFIQLCKRQ
jgi:hypothetical protein